MSTTTNNNDSRALSRRLARELAFQFLYSSMPEAGAGPTEPHRQDFNAFCANFQSLSDDFAWELCQSVGQNLPAIDKTISSLSTNWRIERMPRVDLTILRLAAQEILFRSDIPKTVSINEAIELAKRYGAEDSAAFVNGLLDKINKPS